MSVIDTWRPEFTWDALQQSVLKYAQLSGGLIGILVVWEAIVWITGVNPVILPAPSAIAILSVQEAGFFLFHTWITLIEIFVGFWAGVVFGFASALGIFYVPFLRRGLYPLLAGVSQVPKISFAPLLLVWFGSGLVTNTIISLFIVFFPVLVNTLSGLRETDEDLFALTRLYGVDERFMLRKVRLPSALPLIMASMKLGTAMAVVGAIVAEFVSSSRGLGFLLITSSSDLLTTQMFAAILYTTIIAVGLYAIVLVIERRVLFWYQGDE